jgi:hypothetical protein
MKQSILYTAIIAVTVLASGVKAQNQEPMALGVVGINEVLNEYPIFNRYKSAYKPSQGAIDYLKSYNKRVTVKVFLGTWCIDSIRHVPSYLKTREMIGNNFATQYIGVNRQRSDGAGLAGNIMSIHRQFLWSKSVEGKSAGLPGNPINRLRKIW